MIIYFLIAPIKLILFISIFLVKIKLIIKIHFAIEPLEILLHYMALLNIFILLLGKLINNYMF
jgi:hypothetical protein